MQPDQHKFDPIPGLGDEAPDSSSLDWNSSGTLLAAASAGGTIHIWDADGHLRATLEEHTEDVMAARWSSTGRWLLSAGDRRALMYDSTDFDKPPRVFSQGGEEHSSFHHGDITDYSDRGRG
jgi:WD40 repeat protein